MLVKTSISTTRFLVYLQVYGKKLSKYGTYEEVRESEYRRISSFRPLPVLDISALVTDDVGEVERVSVEGDSGSLEEERNRLDEYLGSVSVGRVSSFTLPDGSVVELVDYEGSAIESLPLNTDEIDFSSLDDGELEARVLSLVRLGGLLDSSSEDSDSEEYSDGYDEDGYDEDSDGGVSSSGEWAVVSVSTDSAEGLPTGDSVDSDSGDSDSGDSEDTDSEDTGSEDIGSEDTDSEDIGSEDTGSEDTGSEDSDSEGSDSDGSEDSSGSVGSSGVSHEGDSSILASEDLGLVTSEDEYEFPTYSILLSSVFNDVSSYNPVSHDLYYKRKDKDKVSVAKFGTDVKPSVEPPKSVSPVGSSSTSGNPTERLEHEDIVSYLRRLVRVKETVALGYFSPREIEASLALGKIVRRHGTLIFSHS